MGRAGVRERPSDHLHHRLLCRFVGGNIRHIVRICRDGPRLRICDGNLSSRAKPSFTEAITRIAVTEVESI